MGLLDELRSAPPRRIGCSFCEWLRSQPSDEQAEWADALADQTITHTALLRAAQRRGYSVSSETPVATHRRAHL